MHNAQGGETARPLAKAKTRTRGVRRATNAMIALSLFLFIASASASGVLRSQPVTGVCDDPAAQESG